MLREHRNRQLEHRLQVGPGWNGDDLVFPSVVGSAWAPSNFYRDYKKVVIASRVADPGSLDFHCLRHTAATQWIRAGADIHVVSRRLGHADPAFTLRVYGHLVEGMQRTAAEALDGILA